MGIDIEASRRRRIRFRRGSHPQPLLLPWDRSYRLDVRRRRPSPTSPSSSTSSSSSSSSLIDHRSLPSPFNARLIPPLSPFPYHSYLGLLVRGFQHSSSIDRLFLLSILPPSPPPTSIKPSINNHPSLLKTIGRGRSRASSSSLRLHLRQGCDSRSRDARIRHGYEPAYRSLLGTSSLLLHGYGGAGRGSHRRTSGRFPPRSSRGTRRWNSRQRSQRFDLFFYIFLLAPASSFSDPLSFFLRRLHPSRLPHRQMSTRSPQNETHQIPQRALPDPETRPRLHGASTRTHRPSPPSVREGIPRRLLYRRRPLGTSNRIHPPLPPLLHLHPLPPSRRSTPR